MDRCSWSHRHQPWSTYAVYLTTVSHWALLWDYLLISLYLDMATSWTSGNRKCGLAILAGWMFLSKFLKLLGHYIRYPADFLLLPISIFFGYFHGLIKGYAMCSLNVVRNLPLVTSPWARRSSDWDCRRPGGVARERMTMTRTE